MSHYKTSVQNYVHMSHITNLVRLIIEVVEFVNNKGKQPM